MTQPKDNILILEEGINRIIVKRAGAIYEIGAFALVKKDNDNYYVNYAENIDSTKRFCFKNREFWNGQNQPKDDRKSYLYN